jgi:rfaE bifunctional protein kinase chain/domain
MDYKKVFNDFDNLNVLIIGDVMMDSYIWGAVERISPEAPVPVVNVLKKEYRLGGAANVALNIASLGAKPVLCALIGDDEEGKKLIQRLDERGISKDGIVQSKFRPTTVKTRIIARDQHVVRVDEEEDKVVNNEEEKLLWERIEKLLPSSHVAIFEDYDKGVLNQSLISRTVELCKKHNIPTVVDPKKRNFLFYENVTLFKPNLKELRDGLKVDVEASDKLSIKAAVEQLKKKLNSKGVMLTLSEYGIYINFDNQEISLPAHAREIADVSGAGDTVVSIAALALASRLTPKEIAFLSNLGGGLVCQYVGVVPIDKEELLREATIASA